MAAERDAQSRASSKHDIEHHDHLAPNEKRLEDEAQDENTFEVESKELPPGYFTSPFFLGTFTGIGLGLMAGVAGYGFAAPILTVINNDIGPVRTTVFSLVVTLTYDSIHRMIT